MPGTNPKGSFDGTTVTSITLTREQAQVALGEYRYVLVGELIEHAGKLQALPDHKSSEWFHDHYDATEAIQDPYLWPMGQIEEQVEQDTVTLYDTASSLGAARGERLCDRGYVHTGGDVEEYDRRSSVGAAIFDQLEATR